MHDLRPCPFCGGKAEIWRASVHPSERPAWVACMGQCCVLVTRKAQTDDEVIALWNTRADDAEVLRLRAALEKIGKTYQCDGNRLIHGPHEIINIVHSALSGQS